MLNLRPDTEQAVRKLYGLDTEQRLKESLDLLQEWLEKQDHFIKKDFSNDYLERMVIAAKGSVEKTKQRLDRVCTFRTLMPQFFDDTDPKSLCHQGKIYMALLPNLTSDHTRIFISDVIGSQYSSKILLDCYKFAIMIAEYSRVHDYASQYEIILDYRHSAVGDVLFAVNVMDLTNCVTIIVEGYGVRVKCIHMLTDSKFMDVLLNLGRQVAPRKLKDRFKVHKNLDTLHEVLDKNILPVEYGGTGTSIKDLNHEILEVMSAPKFRDYWREASEARTDESRRPRGLFNEHYLGVSGSFRALSVD